MDAESCFSIQAALDPEISEKLFRAYLEMAVEWEVQDAYGRRFVNGMGSAVTNATISRIERGR